MGADARVAVQQATALLRSIRNKAPQLRLPGLEHAFVAIRAVREAARARIAAAIDGVENVLAWIGNELQFVREVTS